MEITCDKKEVVHTNKVGSMIRIDIIKDVKMAELTPKGIYNTFS